MQIIPLKDINTDVLKFLDRAILKIILPFLFLQQKVLPFFSLEKEKKIIYASRL